MNLHIQIQILGVIVRIIFDGKSVAVHILIGIQGKGGKGNQIDSIAVL